MRIFAIIIIFIELHLNNLIYRKLLTYTLTSRTNVFYVLFVNKKQPVYKINY